MSDAVSREAVLKAIYDWEEDWNSIYSAVLHLPAVSAKHDFAQPDAAAIREAVLQDAISHVRQALVDSAYKHGSIVTTRFSAMFTAEIIATSALSCLLNPPTGKEVMPDGTREVPDNDTAPAGLSAGGGAEGPFRRDQRDWTEDYAHENGNYMCICAQCDRQFSGHKRRMVCKTCALSRLLNPPTEGQQS